MLGDLPIQISLLGSVQTIEPYAHMLGHSLIGPACSA